jgi:hypothetical protein
MPNIFTSPEKGEFDGPAIFLAGPIQGAPDWQVEAVALLVGEPDLAVFNPRRREFIVEGPDKAAQWDWEHAHLDRAGKRGCIMFWLCREANHDCRRAYAQCTRFELGEAMMRHVRDGVRVVVGIDEGFTNGGYLRHTLAKKAPGIPLAVTLEETVRLAAEAARRP